MEEARVERRLSAIMVADVVGYSRLIELDEAATIAAVRSLRVEVIEPFVAAHHGRIVKLMGDGILCEFGSVVDAVACAVAIQKEIADPQEGASPGRLLVLRVGINLGDVVVDGEDVLGDAVNIAARLQGQADSGELVIEERLATIAVERGLLAAPLVSAPYGARLKGVEGTLAAVRVRGA